MADIITSKECAQQLSVPLSILLSKSFNSTSLPLAWKEALVTPIYKKGDRTAVSNYLPISLTSPIIKIMESIIRDRIQEHMTTNNLFTLNQHGFSSVLLSYSLQLTLGQNLLRRTMQVLWHFWKPLRLVEKFFVR